MTGNYDGRWGARNLLSIVHLSLERAICSTNSSQPIHQAQVRCLFYNHIIFGGAAVGLTC